MATVSGTGAESFTATGAVTVPSATVAGSGAEVFTATGALTVPAPIVNVPAPIINMPTAKASLPQEVRVISMPNRVHRALRDKSGTIAGSIEEDD